MAAAGFVNDFQDISEAGDHICNTAIPFDSASRQCCRDEAIAIARVLILLSHCFLLGCAAQSCHYRPVERFALPL
jgi:hypothetical protein